MLFYFLASLISQFEKTIHNGSISTEFGYSRYLIDSYKYSLDSIVGSLARGL